MGAGEVPQFTEANWISVFFSLPTLLGPPPYNKHYIEQQLGAGGGFILEDFNESQVRTWRGGLRWAGVCVMPMLEAHRGMDGWMLLLSLYGFFF